MNLVGSDNLVFGAEEGTRVLEKRPPRPDLQPDPALPDATRLWAALQDIGGGSWGGAVYDVDSILRVIEAGRQALSSAESAAAKQEPSAPGQKP